ncbi:MAG: efflux RND transporter periplasmic adaptor subunit [Ferrimicrobium acidiphilum]
MHRYRRIVVVSIIAAGVIAVVAFVVAGRTGAPRYQFGYAKPEAVSATVSAIGTLSPTVQAVIPPPIDGTVSSITAHVGQTVVAGETLATISPSANTSHVQIADAAALAQAQAALAQAEQPNQVTTSKNATSSSQALKTDVSALQRTIAKLCPTTKSPISSTCGSLDSELSRLSSQLSGKVSNANSSGREASTASSATIAADQAIVVADQSALTSAQQARPSSLVTPIAGTVAILPLTAGQVVRAQSTSYAITVIQSNKPEVIVPIAISTGHQLHNGDQASIVPFGSAHPTSGLVKSIGTVLTTNKATGVTTIPVVLSINHLARSVFDGTQALVTIDIAHSAHVLAVPTSAINYSAGRAIVLVDGPNGVTKHAVKLGIVGARYTSITGGLLAGDRVVLANLDRPLPTPIKPIGGSRKLFGKG